MRRLPRLRVRPLADLLPALQRGRLSGVLAGTRENSPQAGAWLLLQQDGEVFVNRRKRSLFPIVQQRQQLVDSLARLLSQLGLDRQAKKVEDLDAFLERRAKEMEQEKKDEPEATANNH